MSPRLLAPLAAAVLIGAAPAKAGIWTAVPSGLTAADTITAVDYQGPDRFWYVTDTGRLRYREAGTFRSGSAPNLSGTAFTDVAFQPGGAVGIAVGTGGHVWRTEDGGRNWARTSFAHATSPCGATGNVAQPQINPPVTLSTVAWGPGDIVFAGGEDRTLLRSSDRGRTWTDVNKRRLTSPTRIACRIDRDIADLQPLPTPADGSALRFIAADGVVYGTLDGLQTNPVARASLGCAGTGRSSLALDRLQPVRQWAATPGAIGCLALTTDDATRRAPTVVGGGALAEMKAVAAAGAPVTVVAVARGGGIHTSVDGTNFYPQPADGALARSDWQAVSGYDADNFAVAGAGGALAVTGQASLLPDIFVPEGSIEGPAAATINTPTTYTALATDNAGGSGIDPDAFSWRATGQEVRSGSSATYTFHDYGSHEIVLDFRDRAGNRGSARRLVAVVPPPAIPAVLARPMLAQPRRTAIRKGRTATISVRGRLRLPTGVARVRGCAGDVGVTVLRGTRTLAYRKSRLSRACAYASVVRIAASRLRSARTLRIGVRFFGNSAVARTARTFTAKVKTIKVEKKRKRKRRR